MEQSVKKKMLELLRDNEYEAFENMLALEESKIMAKYGDASAQCALGIIYYKGIGVEQSYAEAFKWFSLAAEQGYALAQYNLSVLYWNGDGVEPSKSMSEYWLARAVEQGHDDTFNYSADPDTQCNIGLCYLKRETDYKAHPYLEYNPQKAMLWFQKAIDQDYWRGYDSMGYVYWFGNGVPQDRDKGAEYFRKAREKYKDEGKGYILGYIACMTGYAKCSKCGKWEKIVHKKNILGKSHAHCGSCGERLYK